MIRPAEGRVGPASVVHVPGRDGWFMSMQILRRLNAVGPTEPATPTCIAEYFTRGQCLMAVADATRFKVRTCVCMCARAASCLITYLGDCHGRIQCGAAPICVTGVPPRMC